MKNEKKQPTRGRLVYLLQHLGERQAKLEQAERGKEEEEEANKRKRKLSIA